MKSTTKTSCSDTSDQTFSITEANTIAVTVPNGGEVWQAGSTHIITWSYTGQPGASVKITLLKAGNVHRIVAAQSPVGAAGQLSFAWLIPLDLVPGRNYKIRVASTKDTLAPTPATPISLLRLPLLPRSRSPLPMAVRMAGSHHPQYHLEFEGNSDPPVKIELLKGGLVNQIIAAGVALELSGAALTTGPFPRPCPAAPTIRWS